MTSYNTLTSARETAQDLGLARIIAATDDQLTAVLKRAASQIDARRYHGAKADPDQEHAFPREGQSSVPAAVLQAEVLQADHLLGGNAAGQAAQDRADGIASKSVGSMSVTYVQGSSPGSLSQALCTEAAEKLNAYRLRGGQYL